MSVFGLTWITKSGNKATLISSNHKDTLICNIYKTFLTSSRSGRRRRARVFVAHPQFHVRGKSLREAGVTIDLQTGKQIQTKGYLYPSHRARGGGARPARKPRPPPPHSATSSYCCRRKAQGIKWRHDFPTDSAPSLSRKKPHFSQDAVETHRESQRQPMRLNPDLIAPGSDAPKPFLKMEAYTSHYSRFSPIQMG